MDEIVLTGLRVVGTHGALDEERERPQPFSVDLVVHADLTAAATSDDLADTIDYGQLVTAVERVVRQEQFRLLEALAGRIADTVLGLDPRATAVEVTVTKLRPPVPVDLASAAVRIRRARS